MLIVHIGLGKTGTTTLQANIFPVAATYAGLAFNPPHIIEQLKSIRLLGESSDRVEELHQSLRRESRLLISSEELVGWDHVDWEANAEANLKLFGSSAVILITIRDTLNYAKSIYQQMIHEGNIKSVEDFFVEDRMYNALVKRCRRGVLEYFNIDAYDLRWLVQLYAKRFSRVLVIPQRELLGMYFLKALLELDESQRIELERLYRDLPRRNRSYSSLAMCLTIYREVFFNTMGASTLGSCQLLTARIRDRYQRKAIAGPTCSWRTLSWRGAMSLVSKIFPHQYELPRPSGAFDEMVLRNDGFIESIDSYLDIRGD